MYYELIAHTKAAHNSVSCRLINFVCFIKVEYYASSFTHPQKQHESKCSHTGVPMHNPVCTLYNKDSHRHTTNTI